MDVKLQVYGVVSNAKNVWYFVGIVGQIPSTNAIQSIL